MIARQTPAPGQSTRIVVDARCGTIAGSWDAQAKLGRFLGIPYAEPPVGQLRFRPTVAKTPWAGTLDASRFGPASAQVFDTHEGGIEDFADGPAGGPDWCVGSEDSLTLNIWTPAADAAKRPVLVWVHGGANYLESGRLPIYHGHRLAQRGDAVFVSFNYRLGIFGFFDISVLGGDAYRGSHSNGLRDQLTALRWVKENIAAFGGDPDNITLMGESAGSMDISWLLGSGEIDALVRRVVMMSNVAGPAGFGDDGKRARHGEAEGQRIARAFLKRLGIDSMSAMMSLTTEEILGRIAEAADWSNILFDLDSIFYPCVSADFAPLDPFRAARAGKGANVDMMIGYTNYEMGLWLQWDDQLDRRPCHWTAARMDYFPDGHREELIARYADWFAQDRPGTHGMHLLGDGMFMMPVTWFAEERLQHNPNVWMYRFDWQVDDRYRAMHAADLCFLFGHQQTPAATALIGQARDEADHASRTRLAASMMDAVLAFARHGDPNAHSNPTLPLWPRYTTDRRAVMSFDAACRILNDPASSRRQWWTEKIYQPVMGATSGQQKRSDT
ncbi:carboxylesterase/lipase family protein [Dongia sp.]|uniref:carboxylesterase/lipase family protein n=1 Tax=Dongia sp. TaxID=1977262 RepID=UPI0035AE3F0E